VSTGRGTDEAGAHDLGRVDAGADDLEPDARVLFDDLAPA
jgi:hypothetical protein